MQTNTVFRLVSHFKNEILIGYPYYLNYKIGCLSQTEIII